jgi:hypothetical protein
MAFAQLTYRESLRDIETCLSVQAAKLYAMGFGDPVRRSTLADANEVCRLSAGGRRIRTLGPLWKKAHSSRRFCPDFYRHCASEATVLFPRRTRPAAAMWRGR